MGATSFDPAWCKDYSELDETARVDVSAWAMDLVIRDTAYYEPMWVRGRTCLEYVEGKIFTPAELAEFAAREMLPIQTPELKPALDAIMGQLLNTGKSGAVAAVQAEDAAGAAIRTVIIKSAERENQLKFREAQVARDTFITSVPGWVWIENFDPTNPDEPGLTVSQEEWDSVIPDASWHDRQLRDLNHATRVRSWTMDDIARFTQDPKVRDRMVYEAESMGASYAGTYDNRATVIQQIRSSRQQFTQTGRLAVFEINHWVRMRIGSWYDPSTDDVGIIPQGWSAEELAQWQEMNPQIQVSVKDNQRVLWVTIVTGTGILLSNAPHWLQAGVFPGIPCVPDRLNGKWAGLVEFVLDTVKGGAYSETEWADTVRTLNKNLLKVRKGAVADMEETRRQAAMNGGIIEIEPTAAMDDVQYLTNNVPQDAFLKWKEDSRQTLSRLLVPDNFVGGVQSSQEANAAIETRIDQTLSRLAPVVWGWHAFRLQIRRVLTKAMPYALTVHKVFRYVDPKNGEMTAEINTPVDHDIYGDVVRTMNNLTGDEYDYIEIESDDSLTGQEYERQQFGSFMEKWGNLPPDALVAAAKNYPNVTVQKFGQDMEKVQQAAAQPKPPEPKISATLDLTALGANPLAQKAAINAGLITQEDLASMSAASTPPEPAMAPQFEGIQ